MFDVICIGEFVLICVILLYNNIPWFNLAVYSIFYNFFSDYIIADIFLFL